ncbi:hypothetical protein TH66_00285 [Carbonactinospora thermoautotrophica]|uniref:Uncharacterized protein n=1 Tax=Carbonactinospora thermoautotrophica TaxID=1469144 RepID=A0A132NIL0_9ACTN|nr:hypothetical protein [Carbonactinospora thermoautotrophica]KWX05987.1 hypothetical protein TH66_00285 [Carbonactinospora thermoautotrophica]KWX09846.1 hypothetical protein TR74_07150 [Carbonactinospora thermoautotrophica]
MPSVRTATSTETTPDGKRRETTVALAAAGRTGRFLIGRITGTRRDELTAVADAAGVLRQG